MVQVSAALAVNNAAAVELQAPRGTDGHRDRLHGDSLLQSRLIILWHVLVPINGHHIPEAPAADDQERGSLMCRDTAGCSVTFSTEERCLTKCH